MPIHLTAAQGYMIQDNPDQALDALEAYEKLASCSIIPMKLHGDSYFNLLDDWLEKTLDLGADFPRDEKLIRKSLIQAVSDNPLFVPLAKEHRYQRVLFRLRQKKKGER